MKVKTALLLNRRMVRDLKGQFSIGMGLLLILMGFAGIGIISNLKLGDNLSILEGWVLLVLGSYFLLGIVLDKIIKFLLRRKNA